uniref:General transcription factor IIH subunit 3 n=1 Tax=Anolis carolinensis TaxID=28377 RepID=A0A803TJM6_ANOCA
TISDIYRTLNLLVIVVDTNPIWWGKQALIGSKLTLSKCLDASMVLGNSHLFMNRNNKLAVIASHIQERYCCFILCVHFSNIFYSALQSKRISEFLIYYG